MLYIVSVRSDIMKILLKNNYEILLFFFVIIVFTLIAYYRVDQLNGNVNYNLKNQKIIVNK